MDVAGTITALPGAAIGIRCDGYVGSGYTYVQLYFLGFDLWENSTFNCRGTPTRPVTIVGAEAVQEGPHVSYPDRAKDLIYINVDPILAFPDQQVAPPSLNERFCESYASQTDFHVWGSLPENEVMTGPNVKPSNSCSYNSWVSWVLQDSKLLCGGVNLARPWSYSDGTTDWLPSTPGSIVWLNTSFDRVNINLNPSDDIAPQHISMDLEAQNNLFRNSRLRIVPAKGCLWTMTDNLFEKETFYQDTSEPLNHHHNAYWPCSDSELIQHYDEFLSPNALLQADTGGTTDSSTDKTLPAAPDYQVGPYGQFYFAPNSATFALLQNAGSQSAAAATLFHYTSRTDEVKDSTQAQVNIGLHYVAAAMNGLPADSDNDGIADYVENWHGDGDYESHQDSETDWRNAFTVPSVADATSSFYDHTDLSGDGVVGRIKNAMNVAPLNPAPQVTLTRMGENDESAQFLVSFPPALDDTVWRPNVRLDCAVVCGGGAWTKVSTGQYQLTITKKYLPIGGHALQAVLTEAVNDRADDLAPCSPLLMWTNDSLFSVEPLACLFGTALVIDAQCDPALDSFDLTLYDDQGGLLGSWPGCGASPHVYQVIDLSTIVNGGPYAGNSITAALALHPVPPKQEQHKILNFLRGQSYTSDYMEFAYGWDDAAGSSADNYRAGMYQAGVVDVFFDPSRANQYFPTPLNAYHTTVFHLYGDWNQMQFQTDIVNLGLVNLFYSGHSSEQSFGSHVHDGDNLINLYCDQVGGDQWLGNSLGPDGAWLERKHPFRFVVMNGCNTAKDDHWATAFGFSPTLNSLDDFLARGIQPAAFVGWTRSIILPSGWWWPDHYANYQDALNIFTTAWMDGVDLEICLYQASGYWLAWPLDEHYKVTGTDRLTRTAYQP